ncbi:MAG TPA: wax ester/triacylglycerol synthase family O-acyltransferase, partial [Burkholderiaceae bacterium]|nr:wax ester/triacylglycerol synthase family O-acyltransferase [Burkholderiaceae bacterium]
MPALSAIDLAMFMLESRERPFNIGPLVLLRPPQGYKGNFADDLTAKLLKRRPGPPFSYRLSMSLTRPPSVEPIAEPDIRDHVHRLTLQRASMDRLLEKICELHETQLDRSGMLWQFYVIDGLDDGRVALYGKVHHGIIDGRTFVKAVTQWMSDDPKDKEVRAMWDGVERKKKAERQRAGVVQSLLDAGGQAFGLVRSAAGVYGLLAEQGLRSAGLGKGLPLPFLNVPGAFDGKLSSQRSYAFCTLPLAELKAAGKAHGATVNDMLLTVLDIAMQRYLAKERKAPREPLVADMPVALAEGAKGGNQIAVLQFPLGRAAASVTERMEAIRAETGRLKDALGKRGSDTVMLYTTLVHALPLLVERVAENVAPKLSNLLVSNPFGFAGEPYLMGAKVELALPVSVVAAGHKLNITAVTLGPRLQIGFLAMPDAVPHIERLARLTE